MALALDFLWLLPIPVLICTAMVMYRRRQHLIYPIFWGYLCLQCFAITIEFICNFISYTAYFYAYWTFSLGILAFSLLLLRSIFTNILKTYSALDKVRRVAYEVALGSIWCAALLVTFRMTAPHSLHEKITRVELAVSFTTVAMFLFVVVASLILGIKWRSAVSGMAAGLALIGTVDLVVYALWTSKTQLSKHATLVGWASTLAFDAAVGIFAFYFVPRRAETEAPNTIRPDLVQWADSVRGAVSK